MTVGERIKKRRIDLGITQEQLAEKMGYSGKSSVCKAETCEDNITTSKVAKYAKALNCPVSYLMGWADINGNAIESNEDIFTEENAHMIKLIREDRALTEALKIYFTYPQKKKQKIIDFIYFLEE